MTGRIEGKVAIVSGAGTNGIGVGTGKAISVVLAREGASVLLVDNVPERAEETLELIRHDGGRAEVYEADISRPSDCAAMVDAAVNRFGGLDILINNAARTKHVDILETTPELFDEIAGVNLKGTFMACKYAIPKLIERGGGSIVNIGSIVSIRDSGSSHPVYSSTKAALLGLTLDLAGAHGGDNVRVNAVLPGLIITPMAQGSRPDTDIVEQDTRPVNLLRRRGDAWDIANAVLFLCSDEGSYITGVTLPVDGGATAAMPSSFLLRSRE